MGWTTFKVTRSTGEVFPLIVAKVAEPINIGTGQFSLSQLLEFSDYPIEAPLFAWKEQVEKFKSFGFPTVYNTADFAGETWTFENNSKIVFSETGSGFDTYDPNGKLAYSGGPATTWAGAVYLDWLVGDLQESSPFKVYYNGTNVEFYNKTPLPPGIHELTLYKDLQPIVESSDPYDPGGSSGSGGGTGSFDGTGDEIGIPSLPTLSSVDAGFITLFNPTLAEMKELSNYMWSDLFDVNGWKKVFADPMDAILGLSIVPVAVPDGGAKTVKVGNISTGVSMNVAASQYVEVDCGTLNVNEYWGAYLDYDPYTKAEIYLPYIGIHPISADDIMNKPVHVVYHVDILSGSCCAYVQCGGTVLYSFIGQCSSSIPITGDNWTNVINGAISIAGSIGSMVATGGASAPMAIGQIASTAVNTMKPSVEKSGAMGGTGGMLGVQTPYLILTRPRQALPRGQNIFMGYPSFITERLGDLTGYTEIDSIHLENIPATEPELSEIESLLKSGVIF